MKAHALNATVALGLLFTEHAFGQSSFAFQTRDGVHSVNAPVFDARGVPLEGSAYLAELWGGPSQGSLAPLILFDGSNRRLIKPFSVAGYIDPPDGGTLVVPSVGAGDWAYLQMRAWDASLGGRYEDVMARGLGGYGESQIFYAQGGSPLGLPTLPGPLIGLESFSLRAVVPEPGTVWLTLAGLPALLWWARRRS